MLTCQVCGGNNFEKHAGFMYCAVCQTQSQEYFEQEYEFQEGNVVRRKNLRRAREKETKKTYDDGAWTSLEAFNYILYGMTQELKIYDLPVNFERMVFKLWAAYLRECKAGFVSRYQEELPKLGFCFKKRDARILYNIDMSSNGLKKNQQRGRSQCSNVSNTSLSSQSSISRKSLAHKKNKIIIDDYEECLTVSKLSGTSLADETLESLGKTMEMETTEELSDGSKSFVKNFKKMLKKKDYLLYKSANKSERLMNSAKGQAKKNIRFLGKNKLLSIIHLALLLTGSQIQLSDLLRFVREGQISFAKVTHFFPSHVKFPKNDFSYIDVISDSLMPTHLRQRKISSQLAHLLKIDNVFTPNMNQLVERYCRDLNLPEQVIELSKRVLASCIPKSFVPTSKSLLPGYEAWAVVSIIFVMKLLFGLNDRTEYFLSHLAREANRIIFESRTTRKSGPRLFVFEDWQKHLECRKTVLTDFHYPTEEQLSGNTFQSCKKFLSVLVKESKDDYRKERFFPYPKYYIEEKLTDGIKEMLGTLSESHNVISMDFQPSLTPQISHLENICHNYSLEKSGEDMGDKHGSQFLPEALLKENFEKCDVEYAIRPKSFLESLCQNKLTFPELFRGKTSYSDLLLECPSKYWIVKYPGVASGHLGNFKADVFEKTPENFQWLIAECARMVEMNVRDVYDELLLLERQLGFTN